MRKYLTQGFLAAATIAFGVSTAAAVDITGAGATFPYPIYAKWAEAYKAKTGVGMNYQSIGSGGGIAQIKAKTVDFGASDMPLKPEDLQAAGLMQFPAIIGGVVPVVNLEGRRARRDEVHGPGARRHLPRQDQEVEREADRRSQSGHQAARRADHGRAPLRRLGHDVHLDRLSVEGEPGMEAEGRRQHGGGVARGRGRQGQRGRRRVRAADQGLASATSSMRTRSATRWRTARCRTGTASSCSPTTTRSRRPRRSPTGRTRPASTRS